MPSSVTLIRSVFTFRFMRPKLDALRVAFWDIAEDRAELLQIITNTAQEFEFTLGCECERHFCDQLRRVLEAKEKPITVAGFLEHAAILSQVCTKENAEESVADYIKACTTQHRAYLSVCAAFAKKKVDPSLRRIERAFWHHRETSDDVLKAIETTIEVLFVYGRTTEKFFCEKLRDKTQRTLEENDWELDRQWFVQNVLKVTGWAGHRKTWKYACGYVDREESYDEEGDLSDTILQAFETREHPTNRSAFGNTSLRPLKWALAPATLGLSLLFPD